MEKAYYEYSVEIDLFRSVSPMKDWCDENIDEDWTCISGGGAPTIFDFVLEEDAVAFKLRWL